jgi:hypothetical protein
VREEGVSSAPPELGEQPVVGAGGRWKRPRGLLKMIASGRESFVEGMAEVACEVPWRGRTEVLRERKISEISTIRYE